MFKGINSESINIEVVNPVRPDLYPSIYYFWILGGEVI
ncbi:unannotated protein [freshwater metagenome]|uniref:Unannotated protein n=1 Tax=freshwater metagenome TaxID=449393 RepID=A0A6J6GG92_9ZZZZ